jgi:hypothetical protein
LESSLESLEEGFLSHNRWTVAPAVVLQLLLSPWCVFIDWDYIKWSRLTTRTLTLSVLVYNVDSTLNKAGSIQKVVNVVLRYWEYYKCIQFTVTSLGKQDMILGYTWL